MALEQKDPGPDHPIATERAAGRVIVTYQNATLADSGKALRLREADYDPVLYIPRSDVNLSLLERSETHTHCPYKGEAAYFTLKSGGPADMAWSYEAPYPAMAEIKDYVAFDPAKVDKIEERRG